VVVTKLGNGGKHFQVCLRENVIAIAGKRIPDVIDRGYGIVPSEENNDMMIKMVNICKGYMVGDEKCAGT